jgi:TolB-like protein
MPQHRQLVAIMFTDIVGYTSLMGEDEQKAFELLKLNRQLQQSLIERFQGKWVKELGDGVLASFFTATDALRCAVSIQQSSDNIPGLRLRIGIHLSEVMMENNDIFGDGINIAAKLQARAPIGGIWISEGVYNNVAFDEEIAIRFVKEETLENIKEPVSIYEVEVQHSHSQEPHLSVEEMEPVKNITYKSIAVLPFVNLSNDPEQEYFSDGMTEEIINSLHLIKELKVAARTSSFQFKGKNVDLREVGEKLGVTTVLEGSVRKQGNRLRVTSQLINTEDGFNLWSERYDRKMDNLFAIQDEIAMAITQKLEVTLLDKHHEIISKAHTENKQAYDLYLKGRFFWNRKGQRLKKGLDYFQQAAAIDPQFAPAYSGIADAYAVLSFYCIMPSQEAMPKAREAAERAIELDPFRIEAHSVLFFIALFYDWNWQEARRIFNQASLINPGYAPIHYWYGFYLALVEGKFEEAIKEAEKATELEPFLAQSHNVLACMLFIGRRYEEAMRVCYVVTELDPGYFFPYWFLGTSCIQLKKIEEGIVHLKKSVDLSARHVWPLADLCYAYALIGKITEAEEILNELVKRHTTESVSSFNFCAAAYELKQYDLAFEILEGQIEQKTSIIICCKEWPTFTSIRNDPRFKKMLEKIGFPDQNDSN